jgi:hypothetical protein
VEAQDPLSVECEHLSLATVAEEVLRPDAVSVEDGPSDRDLEGSAPGF